MALDLEYRKIHQRLIGLGSPEQASKSQRFFKTGAGQYSQDDVFIGISSPVLRALAQEYKGLSLPEIRDLLQSKLHEERLLALFILLLVYKKSWSKKAPDPQKQESIYQLYMSNISFINNWDLVDVSAHYIVGHYLWERDRAVLYELVHSESLWERRIAIIASFYFIKNDDFKDTLALAELLLNDKEDLIHKASGWMLREIGKRDQAREEKFLQAHYHKMPRTMLRYAIEKFAEDLRKAYLEARI